MRRRSGVKRVGHAGTLDPAATGVLPLCLGQATRLIEYLVDATKTYIAEITLGVTTDTYDREGKVLSNRETSHLTEPAVRSVLDQFRGEIDQIPPVFSALKRDGVPLYKLARRGETIDLPARRVRVDRLELLTFTPPILKLEIDCSKGFYVRSLAHDLGAALGVGGMLSALVRSRVGEFRLSMAVGLDVLTAELETDAWRDRLLAADEIILDWQAAILQRDQAARLQNGLPVALQKEAAPAIEYCRAYTAEGSFLAVLQRVDALSWRPSKVFNLK